MQVKCGDVTYQVGCDHATGSDRAVAATGRYWLGRIGLVTAVTLLSAAPAAAKPPGEPDWMMRMLACEGPNAKMEVYLPHSIVFARHGMRAGQTVVGYYALDLTDANKGKPLEPVRVTLSADKKIVIVYQYMRRLPPTRIPVEGGTVDFDKRFANEAKCGPFQSQDPNYGQ
jgi:hypothetical protein